MSLFIVNCAEGWNLSVKQTIRSEIAEKMGALNHVSPKYMAVLFHEYKPENMSPDHGCFVLVYLSEGKSDDFKDEMVSVITNAIVENSDCADHQVAIMINDILRGNMATKGKIVNRGGAVAQLLNEGRLDLNELG